MSETIISGTKRAYFSENSIGADNKYGVCIVSRNKQGQGTGLDLNNLDHHDLRAIADFLEQRLAKKHMVETNG